MNIITVKAVSLPSCKGISQEDFGGCRLPDGFPFLVDQNTQEILEPVFRFVWSRHIKYGNFRPNTAKAEVEDLKDWFAHLCFAKTAWIDACRSDIEEYRDLMAKLISPKTHEKYASKTIARRIGTVQEFYRYFNAQQVTDVDLGDGVGRAKGISLDRDGLAHVRKSGGPQKNNDLLPKQEGGFDDEVRAMTGRQYRLIANVLGPLPKQNQEDLRPVRNRLWAELCLHTGMRPGEPECLTIYDILDLSPTEPANPLGITYLRIRGKGRKFRKVALPNEVLTWLHWYIENEREAAVQEGIRRGHITLKSKPVALFINNADAGHNAGNPMRYQTFHDAFSDAVATAAAAGGQTAGLLQTVIKTAPETMEKYIVSKPKFSPHCLRHTFSVWFYLGEKAAGNPEPWKKLQALLGHAHLATTIETYLRIAGEFEPMVSNILSGHFAYLFRGKE